MTTATVAPPRTRPTTRPRYAGAELSIDLSAIAANTRLVAGRTSASVMAAVKADGFGHGAVDVARTALAHGATSLGVTSVEEGLALRAAYLDAPILSWLNAIDADFGAAVSAGIELAVPGRDHLDAVLRRAPGARIHLQLDTGMARDGAAPTSWADLCRAAHRAEQQGRLRVVGVMGHLACAEEPTDPANASGRARFAWGLDVARGAGLRPAIRHLAATAATLTDPRAHHTLVRIGAGLVGIDPSGTVRLRTAMALTAALVDVRHVHAGTPVGYGHAWTSSRSTVLGLLPLGYADGLPRAASGRAEVLVRGRRRPLVGRISMDMAVVDLGDGRVSRGAGGDSGGEEFRPGEAVTVFGPGDSGEPTVAEWAGWAGTLPHEIVTGIGARVRRVVRPAGPRTGGTSVGRSA